MKRYEKYKPTGIQWLPEIPEHWKVQRFGSLFKRKVVANDPSKELLSVFLDRGVIKASESDKRTHQASDDLSKYQLVEPTDFVMNNQQAWRGSVGVSNFSGIISPAYHLFAMPSCYNPHYANYLLRDSVMVNLYDMSSKGVGSIQRTLNFNWLNNGKCILPSITEQNKIVAYLNERITLIDNCKCQRERELQTLNELKQAEIASVVTRGLNPNVPMKDSGIPWIEQIPEHWGIRRAKFMFKKEKREVRPTDRVITCFRDGQVTLRENRRTTGFTESITEIGYQGIRKGDLVIHQMDAFAGSIGVSDSDGKGTSVYHCCTPKGPYIPQYYALVLREMARTGFIQSLYRGIRERSSDFNFQTFGKQYLPIPPENEQKEIVNFIHARINKIDTMIEALKAEIDRLTEYKQRLISDVVTGQIDVRSEQI
mgnify:CR=1 FL=1